MNKDCDSDFTMKPNDMNVLGTTYAEALLPESFVQELTDLINSNKSTNSLQPAFIFRPKNNGDMVQNVEDATDLILRYFQVAGTSLRSMYTQEDIQLVFESIPAVEDISHAVVKTKKYLPNLSTGLETFKNERSGNRLNIHTRTQHLTAHHPPPTTSSASLSRNRRMQALESVSVERLLDIGERVRSCQDQWQDLHSLSVVLEQHMAMATEWAEFNHVIMRDIGAEIDECYMSLLDIRGKLYKHNGPINLELLCQSLRHVPLSGCQILPYRSDLERDGICK